jgi:glycosyltransferase involved in cell wall biosynthesis
MAEPVLPKVALLWSQFAAYHVDRCEAVARRLAGRAEVWAVEVATSSATYAWGPSGEVAGAQKVTLFPGRSYDDVSMGSRLWAQFKVLRRCKMVLIGIGYNEPDIIILAWLLRLWGVTVVLLCESKFDDSQRSVGFELFKSLLLTPFNAAIVGAQRQMSYLRFLGFRRRRVLPGYDCVGLDRIRAQGGAELAPHGELYDARHFIFVGRFVAKKNLFELLDGYADYVVQTGDSARRLILVGSGPDEVPLREHIVALGISHKVDFPGFLAAEAVSTLLARSLALVLVSREEQWGLVVNEALAFGLPVITSTTVGSRDVLVRNLINGFVIETGSIKGIAHAMTSLSGDEHLWRRMVAASHQKAWLGDTERLADAVELLLDPAAEPAGSQMREFIKAMG